MNIKTYPKPSGFHKWWNQLTNMMKKIDFKVTFGTFFIRWKSVLKAAYKTSASTWDNISYISHWMRRMLIIFRTGKGEGDRMLSGTGNETVDTYYNLFEGQLAKLCPKP